MYSAGAGLGAYCNNEKIHVSNARLNDDSTVANFDASSWYMPKDEIYYAARKIVDYMDVRAYSVSIGSIIHAGCLVAEGKFVAEVTGVSKGKNMDVAALKVIVEEAGGRVTDIFGRDQRYDRDINGAIISNGVVHDELVKAFAKGAEK
jgi:fructose-1,6-bisphosphatase/inositol monophosphatase family enzyme